MTGRRACELGWQRVDGDRGKLSAVWRHRDGWILQHCGHPTANWPWVLLTPPPKRAMVGTGAIGGLPERGTAWRSLALAMAYVAALLAAGWRA